MQILARRAAVLDFGAGSLSAQGGSTDCFVTKLDAHGAALWSWQAGDSAYCNPSAVAADAAGNIVVAGFFGGTIHAGATTLENVGDGAAGFVVKLDPAGAPLWAKVLRSSEGGGDSDVVGLVTTPDGTVLLGGLGTSVDLGGPPPAPTDYFVASFDPSGTFRWSRQVDAAALGGIALAPQGALGGAGIFAGTLDLGDGPITGPDESGTFAFTVDAEGHLLCSAVGHEVGEQQDDVAASPGGDVLAMGTVGGDPMGHPKSFWALAMPR